MYVAEQSDNITKRELELFRENILEQDPSFQQEFLRNIVFHRSNTTGPQPQLLPDAVNLLESWQTKAWGFITSEDCRTAAASLGAQARSGAQGPWIMCSPHTQGASICI